MVQSLVIAPDGKRAYVPHTRSSTGNRALIFDTTVFPLISVLDLAAGQHLLGQQFDLGTLDPPVWGCPLTPPSRLMGRSYGWLMPPAMTCLCSIWELAGWPHTSEILLSPLLLNGKRLFHASDDARLARDQWISCNTCHFEGEQDGHTWTFGFSGPRNTTSLLGMIETYPLRWSGEWDESADSEFASRRENFGTGLIEGAMNCVHQLYAPPGSAVMIKHGPPSTTTRL